MLFPSRRPCSFGWPDGIGTWVAFMVAMDACSCPPPREPAGISERMPEHVTSESTAAMRARGATQRALLPGINDEPRRRTRSTTKRVRCRVPVASGVRLSATGSGRRGGHRVSDGRGRTSGSRTADRRRLGRRPRLLVARGVRVHVAARARCSPGAGRQCFESCGSREPSKTLPSSKTRRLDPPRGHVVLVAELYSC